MIRYVACTKSPSYRPCVLLTLALALLSAFATSQTLVGTISGTVSDETGAVIRGAEVTVVDLSTGLERDALTDIKGQYHLAGLPTGSYSVRIEKEGFQAEVREGVTINAAAAIAIKRFTASGSGVTASDG